MHMFHQRTGTVGIVVSCVLVSALSGRINAQLEIESAQETADATPSITFDQLAQIYADNLVLTFAERGAPWYRHFVTLGTGTAKPNILVRRQSGGEEQSDLVAIGQFTGGTDADSGTLPLPSLHQVPAGPPTEVYAGGIGIPNGVVLSTGSVSDGDGQPTSSEFGTGLEGPNNGESPADIPGGTRWVSRRILQSVSPPFIDRDLITAVPGIDTQGGGGGDSTAIEFTVQLHMRGRIQFKFVYGSDEWPSWLSISEFDDVTAIFVDGAGDADQNGIVEPANGTYEASESILLFNVLGTFGPLKLTDIDDCPQIFMGNQASPHSSFDQIAGVGTFSWFDHELDGFTSVLRRESPWLNPGIYKVKIAITDVEDRIVDSAIFLSEDSIYNFILPGDFNGDMHVDAADAGIMFAQWGSNPGAASDINGDGVVDAADAGIMFEYWGQYREDLDVNRDAKVDCSDLAILDTFFGMIRCASLFEGDIDGDGDVDVSDRSVLAAYVTSVGIDCGSQQAASAGSTNGTRTQSGNLNVDWNQNGIELDAEDLAFFMYVFHGDVQYDTNGNGVFDDGDSATWYSRIKEQPSKQGQPTPILPGVFGEDGE